MKNQETKTIWLVLIVIICICIGILVLSPHKAKAPVVVRSAATSTSGKNTDNTLNTGIIMRIASTTQSSIEKIVAAPALSLNVATGTAYEQVYQLYIANHDVKKTIEVGPVNKNVIIVKLINIVNSGNVTLSGGITATLIDVTFLTNISIRAGDIAFEIQQ